MSKIMGNAQDTKIEGKYDKADKIKLHDFPAVSNTALMTVFCRARDFTSNNSILKDEFAYSLYRQIDCDWKTVSKRLHHHDYVLMAIRGRKFDEACTGFLSENPGGIIVSLGAGLDYRFGRIDNGSCVVVDLDLPEVILLKKKLMPECARYVLIGQSVLDFSWISRIQDISRERQAPVSFIAEGLFPYLDKVDLKEMLQMIGQAFPRSEIFFDVCGNQTLKLMSQHSGIGDWKVSLKSGFRSGVEIEDWNIGFKLLEEWYYPQDPDARRGMMKLMWLIPLFKSMLFFIRGRFEG